MKTRNILITLVLLSAIGAVLVISRCKSKDADNGDAIGQYVSRFVQLLKTGKKDSLSAYFVNQKTPQFMTRLINITANKKDYSGKSPALVHVGFDEKKIQIKNVGLSDYEATLPLVVSCIKSTPEDMTITVKIHQTGKNHFVISELDARIFMGMFVSYENSAKYLSVPDSVRFSAISLAAFKTADRLKARYDSVMWFEHVDNKTWFYVIKGKWNNKLLWGNDDGKKIEITHKMGLVSPELKEIIPAEYDLVHNVGGTIEGMIEVETGDKKGLYDINGKIVVPAEYDELFPMREDNDNLALMRKGDDYFYLKKGGIITEKQTDLKIGDVLPQIKRYDTNYKLSDKTSKNVMEWNDRDWAGSLVISPSYLVNWDILPKFMMLPNPLRKTDDQEEEGYSAYYEVTFDGRKKEADNWIEGAYYSVMNDYLGSRGGLYTNNAVVIVNKKNNRAYGRSFGIYHGGAEGGGALSGKCSEEYVRAISDSLYEFKATAEIDQTMINGQVISDAPYYHYLTIKDGKLVSMPENRMFACTQYVKMDDTYLSGCFIIDKKQTDKVNADILQYMKNEIYASYRYKFKNPKWASVFEYRYGGYDDDKMHANVDDSLTVIDKYNINFITQKLKSMGEKKLAAK
ncbi:MAG: WG repeat-containing protein [Bacteroidota bacterium]